MAKDLQIDKVTGDLVINELFDFDVIEDEEEVAQHMTTELGTDRGGPGVGHCIDTAYGVPYFDVVFVKNPDLGLITSLLREVISRRPDVREVLSFVPVFDAGGRQLDITFEAETTEGLVSVFVEV